MKAIFFDRDGTLNIDEDGYINNPAEMHLYPSVPEVLKYLKLLEYRIFVISNQSGIGRGMIKPEEYRRVNSKFLALAGGYSTIDDIMYCPHKPDDCSCRKPSPFFLNFIKENYNIDFKRSYFVGDKASDVLCGSDAGLKTILIVHPGKKADMYYGKKKIKPDIIIKSIEEMLKIISE
jgi:D-glycero-D-manno-heptose 1,7-bisphosphate phosphatase